MNQNTKCPSCGTSLHGRYCGNFCGYVRPKSQDERLREGDLRLHKKVEPEDGAALLAALAAYGILLPKNAIEWRRADARGTLPSLNMEVTLVATDGVVAWFVLADGRPFFGHLAAFAPTKEVKPERAKSKAPSKRKALLDLI